MQHINNHKQKTKISRSCDYSLIHNNAIICPYNTKCAYNKEKLRNMKNFNEHLRKIHSNAYNAQTEPLPDMVLFWGNDLGYVTYNQCNLCPTFLSPGWTRHTKDELKTKKRSPIWTTPQYLKILSTNRNNISMKQLSATKFFDSAFGIGTFTKLQQDVPNSNISAQIKKNLIYMDEIGIEPKQDILRYYLIKSATSKKIYVGSTILTFNYRMSHHIATNGKTAQLIQQDDAEYTLFAMVKQDAKTYNWPKTKSDMEMYIRNKFHNNPNYEFINSVLDEEIK